MQSVHIITRTLTPTDTADKRVAVKSKNGTQAVFPWDHRYDDPEVHENAARKVAEQENPGQEITMQRVDTNALGYTFRALIGRV